jgi:hypothetical protein
MLTEQFIHRLVVTFANESTLNTETVVSYLLPLIVFNLLLPLTGFVPVSLDAQLPVFPFRTFFSGNCSN